MPEEWTGNLIGIMHNHGIRQKDVAEELGWTKGYVGMILRSKRNPPAAQERMEQAVDTIIKRKEAKDGK